uniref:Uncharacterized protein n=2 Tax=Poecilia TaxID=8080 RepID=A0A3B3UGH5_9TELE
LHPTCSTNKKNTEKFTLDVRNISGNVHICILKYGSAFSHCVWHRSTRRIDHGHEAYKAKILRLEVNIICVEGKTFGVLVFWQEQVTETCRGKPIVTTCNSFFFTLSILEKCKLFFEHYC